MSKISNYALEAEKIHYQKYKECYKRYRELHREERRAYNKKYREEHLEQERARNIEYKRQHKKEMAEYGKQYEQAHREKRREINRRYKSRHPNEKAVWRKTNYAIRKGELIKQPCESCGKKSVEAHHDNYNKPLEVRWLCRGCHVEWHRNNKPIRKEI